MLQLRGKMDQAVLHQAVDAACCKITTCFALTGANAGEQLNTFIDRRHRVNRKTAIRYRRYHVMPQHQVLHVRRRDQHTLGPAETAQVRNLIRQLREEGIGIFLISHDIHDVFDLSDRISVMYHGQIVGTVNHDEVTTDDVLGMIILGKPPTDVSEEEREALH